MAKILFVDDHEGARRSMKVWLSDRGHQVEVAADGDEALPMIQSNGFDLVITDLDMPRMNGDELCRQLKAISPDLPIIMITGKINPPACPADVILDKVGALEKLPGKIEALLQK